MKVEQRNFYWADGNGGVKNIYWNCACNASGDVTIDDFYFEPESGGNNISNLEFEPDTGNIIKNLELEYELSS